MNLTTDKSGANLTVHLSGELNTNTAPQLDALLNKEFRDTQILTLDFTECDYVSSAGLRVLLLTFKRMKAKGGNMELSNIGEDFMDVLTNTGLDAVFGIG